MSALRDFLLAPAPTSPRARAPAGSHPALGVVAPAAVLGPVCCAAGVALARRARAPRALVCTYTGADALARPPRAPGDALAAALDARGITTQRRGRVLLAELPGDAAVAARTATVAQAVAAPSVLGVSLRAAALDDLLATCDALLVVAPGDGAIAELALASAAVLGRATLVLNGPLAPVARALAVAGLSAPAGVRRAIAEVLP